MHPGLSACICVSPSCHSSNSETDGRRLPSRSSNDANTLPVTGVRTRNAPPPLATSRCSRPVIEANCRLVAANRCAVLILTFRPDHPPQPPHARSACIRVQLRLRKPFPNRQPPPSHPTRHRLLDRASRRPRDAAGNSRVASSGPAAARPPGKSGHAARRTSHRYDFTEPVPLTGSCAPPPMIRLRLAPPGPNGS